MKQGITRENTLRILKIVGALGLVYLVSWFLLVAVGLSNHRTEALLAFGKALLFFIRYILGFPSNLMGSEYPFLMDHTGKTIESSLHPLALILINFTLQVLIIHWILKRRKRSSSANATKP